MKRTFSFYANIFCIFISLFFWEVSFAADSSAKKPDKITVYGVLSYNLKLDNVRNTTQGMNQIESKQLNSEQISDNVNSIKNHIVSINEIHNLDVREENLLSKNISTIDNPDIQRIVDDPNTVANQKKYFSLDNKLVKVTFELDNPTMNLIEEYYILDNTKIFYKSSNYYGIITIETNKMLIDTYYPDYKKNISKLIFLNELQKLNK